MATRTPDNAGFLPPWLQRWEDDGGTWRSPEVIALIGSVMSPPDLAWQVSANDADRRSQ